MDPVSLIKAMLMQAAYQGASAVCGTIDGKDGQPLPIDPLIQDAGLQQKGVLVYELAKVQYHALLRAFHDKTGIWPDPKVPEAVGVDIPALIAQGLKLLPKDGALGPIVDVLGRISKL